MKKQKIRICYTFRSDLEKMNIRQKSEKITENSNLINQLKNFDFEAKNKYLFFADTNVGLLYIIKDLIYIGLEKIFSQKLCGMIKNNEKDNFLCFYGYESDSNTKEVALTILFYYFENNIKKLINVSRKDKDNEIPVLQVIMNKNSNLIVILFEDGYIKIISAPDFHNKNLIKEFDISKKERIRKIGIQKYSNNMLNLVFMSKREIFFKQNIDLNVNNENVLLHSESICSGLVEDFECFENSENIFMINKKDEDFRISRINLFSKKRIFSVNLNGKCTKLLRFNNYAIVRIVEYTKKNANNVLKRDFNDSDSLFIYDMKNEYLAYKFNKRNTIIYKLLVRENEVIMIIPDAKNKGKEIYKIKDTSDQEKLDKFMKRTFFDLAYKFAENKKNIELKLEICKEAGDHYYKKNNYEKAIENYIKTITALELKLKNVRDFEPCVVIKKFLDMNQLTYLIQYLEALHKSKQYTVNIHHSSLLVHSYLKQKDIKGLKDWFVQYKGKPKETVEMTINACLEYEEIDLAKFFAEISKRHKLYINISIENSFYGESNREKLENEVLTILEYIKNIDSVEEKILFIRDNGYLLLPFQPKMLINMIIEHLEFLRKKDTRNFSMEGLWDVFQNILECYQIEEMEKFVTYLKKNLKDFERGKKETASFIINYYIMKYKNSEVEKKKKYLKIIDDFIENDKLRRNVDNIYLIFIFTKMEMKKQKMEIMKKMGKKKELIEWCFEEGDYEECMEFCKRYHTDPDLPVYFLRLICEKKNEEDCNKYIPLLLELIGKEDRYSLHFIIKLLKQNKTLKLEEIKDYFLEFIKKKTNAIEKEKEEYFVNIQDTHKKKKKLLKLKISPHLFQPTNCFACKSKATNPVIYFLCGHIYHYNCIEDYSCHECQLEHNEIIEKRELFENDKIFIKDLSKVDFNNCVDYFGKVKF